MADESRSPFANLFDALAAGDVKPSVPSIPSYSGDIVRPVDVAPLGETMRVDEQVDALEAIRASVEESSRMASASDRRSRIMLWVGVATLAATLFGASFAVWAYFHPLANSPGVTATSADPSGSSTTLIEPSDADPTNR